MKSEGYTNTKLRDTYEKLFNQINLVRDKNKPERSTTDIFGQFSLKSSKENKFGNLKMNLLVGQSQADSFHTTNASKNTISNFSTTNYSINRIFERNSWKNFESRDNNCKTDLLTVLNNNKLNDSIREKFQTLYKETVDCMTEKRKSKGDIKK